MKKVLPFLLLVVAVVLGLFYPSVEVINVAENKIDTGDTAWLLVATALVLLMTPGLAYFYGGMVRKKNVISTMLQCLVCMGRITVLWVVLGFSLAFGEDIGGVIGNPGTFFMMKGMVGNAVWPLAPTIPVVLFAMFQL